MLSVPQFKTKRLVGGITHKDTIIAPKDERLDPKLVETTILAVSPSIEESLPSTATMASNLFKSAKDIVKSAVSGQGVGLTEDERIKRMSICNICNYFRHSDQRCSKCGCYMAVKTYFKATKCPVGKW